MRHREFLPQQDQTSETIKIIPLVAYEKTKDLSAHIDYIIDIADSIKPGKVTILTGPNGYGKSVVRKLVSSTIDKEIGKKTASISMERRTQRNHDFSALASLAIDDPDDATSNHTCKLVKNLFAQADRYYVIDEPEIGMGKEMLLGLLMEIETKITELRKSDKFYGLLIITHSEFVIDNLKYDEFINMEGMTYDEWKNREIVAISPSELSEWCLNMWRAIQKRSDENKAKKK